MVLDIVVRFIFVPGIIIWVISLIPEMYRDVKGWINECFQFEQVQEEQPSNKFNKLEEVLG